jgi:hypothetical protein
VATDICIKKHLQLLGLHVTDKITGFKGIVSSIGFSLYGYIHVLVDPGHTTGKPGDSYNFDAPRLTVTEGSVPILPTPTFDLEKSLEFLGYRATDLITDMEGVITSISFDLYGCVQGVLTVKQKVDSDKPIGLHWVHLGRLKITSKTPVIPPPNFFGVNESAKGNTGPANKPSFCKG